MSSEELHDLMSLFGDADLDVGGGSETSRPRIVRGRHLGSGRCVPEDHLLGGIVARGGGDVAVDDANLGSIVR